ncbi:GGDEF domain-containing protein [Rhodococcus sp. 14-2470-1a]|uniref:GGDEF domain-containing protein n=1 Tax=Rhodococcus sp. 14-2470-1a TaxID=2023150 RepID=UPI000B9BDF26|nr:GGDEF domain-containing protein [Rhodococcus sp. 14-2470-1a]OZF42077.1 GGDEF domain-containing protein [Rhodococcus sp. 14-2470-1a]
MQLLHRWWTHPADYAWTADYYRSNPLLRHVRLALGTWCWLYAVLCVLAAFTPAGAPDGTPQVLAFALATTAAVIGGWWIRGPWPSETTSRLFVTYLELSAAAALLILADPFVALPCAAAFAVIGGYIAAVHSPKMIVAHQLWAATITAILFVRAITEPGADIVLACAYLLLLTLVLFSAPMLTHVLLLLLRRDAAAAFYDPLTGLRNRRGLAAAIAEPRTNSGLQDGPAAVAVVMAIDLDDFKAVNDRHGHAHGDLVLQHTANAIYHHFPPPAITARTGGEEFVIVTHTHDPAEAIADATALQRWFAALPDSAGTTVSIGVAHDDASRLAATFEQIQSRADAAMYAAKHAGGNTLHIHRQDRAPADE